MMRYLTALLAAAALCLAFAPPGHAQTTTGNEFQTGTTGKTAPGVVVMCLDAGGLATPATAAGTCAGSGGGGGSVSAASGGVASYSRIASSAASTNLTNAKASAGRVYKVTACNTTAAPIYMKFYNVASATVGTTPVVFSRLIPAGTAAAPGCYSGDQANIGWYFSTAISYAFTTGTLDSDTAAITSGAILQSSVEYQ